MTSSIEAAAARLKPVRRVTALGDSLSDSGTFKAITATGRFTTPGGSMWVEHIAAALGHTLAPEHICDGKAFTRAGGSNYAQSGAMTQAEPGLHDGLSWSLAHQIDVHLAAGGPHADDLLLVSIGGPDVLAALLEVQQGALTPEAAMRSCDVAVAACATQLERLLAAGAKRVAIANVADFGRTPAFASLPPAAGLATALAQQWNRLLAEQAPLRDARATLVDAFAAFGDMLDHPAAYGFTNVRDQAFDPQRTPPSATGTSPNGLPEHLVAADAGSTYLFADFVHPTGNGHRHLAARALDAMAKRWG